MEDVYRKLQKHLDHSPIGYPATRSGVELRLLRHFFTPEEAGIALNLSMLPEPLEKIHKRMGKNSITKEELEHSLDKMDEKGAIMCIRKGKDQKVKHYHRIPLAIGMFEFQVDRVTPELARDFYEYEEEAFAREVMQPKTRQMRTIPVNVKIEPEFHVGNYDKVREIIGNSPGPFAVMNCVCRQAKDALGEPCQQTEVRETCLILENSARRMMDRGVARELTRQEMLKMITRAKKEGMVLQPENNQKPGFICCCCGCCCGALKAAKQFDKPAEFMHTNFYAEVVTEECDACEDCQDLCQMEALHRMNGYMIVDRDRCIGCGLCIGICPNKAIKLIKKEKEFIPPKDASDMYKKITFNKYGLLGTLKFLGKASLGQKV